MFIFLTMYISIAFPIKLYIAYGFLVIVLSCSRSSLFIPFVKLFICLRKNRKTGKETKEGTQNYFHNR